ncbi:uncharacterized protein BO88DRAFT_408181 [Aspergillus vadensis CBS 113365]|uniref:Transcriptional regulatory protein RXT2 N-terminal domain-containing protein n=1 Tax=Aspergillus vadensis (strain CBS 113365 / IMI 142717 / IBT 24658) TaxID=1448311 RepID=A0A319AX97_ASPVC|nr:hypothetical protein BO88DRAFT_408181 [Aspergillus vadensis CBS 113365]PYH64869.1 hypothetical protein BO88DRAFT_408181 [Aspergillus vadensis CBS 113365]
MAAQAALIADTIVGMKRALRKENDYSGPDDPITQPTNRGNKLHTNSNFVREGALGYIHPEELYKQKIEHAGYTRYILQPNPVRYDSEGDELDEDDEDSEADAAAAAENPFSEIALENFLCPLKHPSELPTHPSLSHAYTSKALLHMTQAIEAKLRQERALLWRARNLHRQFLGDSSWMPSGAVETPEDRWIFEPRIAHTTRSSPGSQYRHNGTANPLVPGPSVQKSSVQGASVGAGDSKSPRPSQNENAQDKTTADKDVEMTDIHDQEMTHKETVANALEQPREPKSEEVDTPVGDLPHHSETINQVTQVNGSLTANAKSDGDKVTNSDGTLDKDGMEREVATTQGNAQPDSEIRDNAQVDGTDADADADAEMQDGSSPEPPRRMTTRAQANAANPQEGDSGPLSPSPSDDTLGSLPTPHPLFLIPDSVRPDSNFGLPPNEAEETRRLLWSYVQKQEETVRGFEHMLESLLRANRMKEDVLEWCKAEGHVGEMSDGEDWYDREKWGLAEGEDLKKGADEDEIEPVEESRTSTKRGRGRRA